MPKSTNAGRATLKEVAELAGVSLMTVSRAVRHPEVLAETTRKKVQAAIKKLNYIPDDAAGDLSSRKSTTVAVVIPSLHFEGHARTLDGLSSELRKHGLYILIADSFYSRSEDAELLRRILGRRPAGLVLINSAHSSEGVEVLQSAGVPVIETWDIPANPLDSVVGFSHAEVGAALTTHLIDQGHEYITFLGGPLDTDPRGNERLAGFKRTMTERGLDASRVVTVEQDHLTINAGKIGIARVLDRFPDTTASICLTDRVAMGAMMECRRRGVSVPDDLALTGHGDFEFSEHLVPSLTTTRIDAFGIGVHAARILHERITTNSMNDTERHVDVGFEVVVRDSSQAMRPSTRVKQRLHD